MIFTTTDSIRLTGKRMGFSKEVIYEAIEKFLFGTNLNPIWPVPDKDYLFQAHIKLAKLQQKKVSREADIKEIDKLINELDSFMSCG